MKITRTTTFSMLIIASLTLLFSACGNAADTTANNANKSNTAVVANSNRTPVSNTAPVSNTTTAPNGNSNVNKTSTAPTPAAESEAEKIQGEVQAGKTKSVILYVGEESGDYAAYCFTNDSEAGRAILDACKNGERCEVTGTVDSESACKVPGLEANLSASGRILKVESAKSLGRKK